MNIKKYISHLFGKFVLLSPDEPKVSCENDKKYTSPLFEKFALLSEDVLEASPPGDPFWKSEGTAPDGNNSDVDTDSGTGDERWDW